MTYCEKFRDEWVSFYYLRNQSLLSPPSVTKQLLLIPGNRTSRNVDLVQLDERYRTARFCPRL